MKSSNMSSLGLSPTHKRSNNLLTLVTRISENEFLLANGKEEISSELYRHSHQLPEAAGLHILLGRMNWGLSCLRSLSIMSKMRIVEMESTMTQLKEISEELK